jgi:hypothetical protein
MLKVRKKVVATKGQIAGRRGGSCRRYKPIQEAAGISRHQIWSEVRELSLQGTFWTKYTV